MRKRRYAEYMITTFFFLIFEILLALFSLTFTIWHPDKVIMCNQTQNISQQIRKRKEIHQKAICLINHTRFVFLRVGRRVSAGNDSQTFC